MQGRLETRIQDQSARAPRRKLFLAAAVSQTDSQCEVDIFNLSESGLLLRTDGDLSLDEPLVVVLPDVGEQMAKIVWSADGLYGCRFENPLSQAEISASLLRSTPRNHADAELPALSEQKRDSFGKRLKLLRMNSGQSMVGLANQIGVSKPTLWKWETDRVRPRDGAIKTLAARFGVGEFELLYGTPEASTQAASPSARPVRSSAVPEVIGTLAGMISQCKNDIAKLAGVENDKVSIVIDWN